AIGVGFALGPAIGGVLAGEDPASANFLRPALVSAGLSLLALSGVWLVLPESHRPGQGRSAHEPRLSLTGLLRAKPGLRLILVAALLVTTGHGILETIATFWAMDLLGFGPRRAGFLLLSVAV